MLFQPYLQSICFIKKCCECVCLFNVIILTQFNHHQTIVQTVFLEHFCYLENGEFGAICMHGCMHEFTSLLMHACIALKISCIHAWMHA